VCRPTARWQILARSTARRPILVPRSILPLLPRPNLPLLQRIHPALPQQAYLLRLRQKHSNRRKKLRPTQSKEEENPFVDPRKRRVNARTPSIDVGFIVNARFNHFSRYL
jgi:hypothetical protein